MTLVILIIVTWLLIVAFLVFQMLNVFNAVTYTHRYTGDLWYDYGESVQGGIKGRTICNSRNGEIRFVDYELLNKNWRKNRASYGY